MVWQVGLFMAFLWPFLNAEVNIIFMGLFWQNNIKTLSDFEICSSYFIKFLSMLLLIRSFFIFVDLAFFETAYGRIRCLNFLGLATLK